jgi:hypothetical protein
MNENPDKRMKIEMNNSMRSVAIRVLSGAAGGFLFGINGNQRVLW